VTATTPLLVPNTTTTTTTTNAVTTATTTTTATGAPRRDEVLGALRSMGFTDAHLNATTLAAHDDDLARTLHALVQHEATESDSTRLP